MLFGKNDSNDTRLSEVINGGWLLSKSLSNKVTKMNSSTVISHYQLSYRGCYLDDGQRTSEIQIVWVVLWDTE